MGLVSTIYDKEGGARRRRNGGASEEVSKSKKKKPQPEPHVKIYEKPVYGAKFRKKLNDRSTDHEKKFESILKMLRIPYEKNKALLVRKNFHRYPDFYIAAYKLIVEIDGGYHDNPEQQLKDKVREQELLKIRPDFKIIRITNEELDKSFPIIKERMRTLSQQYTEFYKKIHEYCDAQFGRGHTNIHTINKG